MLSAAEKLAAELGDEPKTNGKAKREPSGDGLFDRANAVDTVRLLDMLGIEHTETPRGEMATCPGCGEDGALVCRDGGLRCQHDRCKHAGPMNYPGFRSPIDIVAERERLEPADAAKWICERFGIPIPKAKSNGKTAEPPPDDDYEHTDADAPDAPPRTDGSSNEDRTAEPKQSQGPKRLADILVPSIEVAERRRTGEERPVPLPFESYSEILGGGLWPGVHTCVSGTGIGKTSLWLQSGLHAAENACPVLYVGLELGETAVGLPLLGERTGLAWSSLYTGRCSERHIEKARAAVDGLSELPFYVEFGDPNGWPASRMAHRVSQIRKQHPTGPLLVVLDFLQIVGAELDDSGRQPDLREAIKRAAYVGTFIGNQFGAATVLVSSAARDKYGLLASTADSAGLGTMKIPGRQAPVRTVMHPEALIGLGKEAGEIEYAAESQTVLIRWPKPLENGEKAIIAAVPKLRYGPPSWFALSFWHRFSEYPIESMDELPSVERDGGGKVSDDDLEAMILTAARRHPDFTSANDLAGSVGGNRKRVLGAIRELRQSGRLEISKEGCHVIE